MLGTNFVKIYSGSFIIAQLIRSRLEDINIIPVIKDESESGRLAGFGSSMIGNQDLFVHENQEQDALIIVNQIRAEIETNS